MMRLLFKKSMRDSKQGTKKTKTANQKTRASAAKNKP